ncbi:MAG: HNH endonuclease [Lachnospiraceae bacterium]|nr:HNH endonuclease [Lachnospiraceae bacterium]
MDREILYIIIALLFGLFSLFFVKYMRRRQAEDAAERKRREVAGRRYIPPKIRAYVLERDDYTCQICGISRSYFDEMIPYLGDYLLLEVDHIRPVAYGGRGDEVDNLQTLCWRCNRKKGKTKTNAEVMDEIDYGIAYLEDDLDD